MYRCYTDHLPYERWKTIPGVGFDTSLDFTKRKSFLDTLIECIEPGPILAVVYRIIEPGTLVF